MWTGNSNTLSHSPSGDWGTLINLIIFSYPCALVCFVLWETPWPKPTQRGKGLLHLTSCSPSWWEFRARTLGRNWIRGYRGALLTGLLTIACSSCFLIQPRNPCPDVTPPTVSLNLPHEWLIKKITQRLAYRPTWWKYFFDWGFLFPDDSSLCQVDKK